MIEERLYHYRGELIRIIDGDTIVANIDLGFGLWQKNVSIRLLGIDAPERNTEAGQRSLEYLNFLLQEPEYIVIRTFIKDQEDNFGRCLGIIYGIDDININLLMVNAAQAKFRDDWGGEELKKCLLLNLDSSTEV